MANDGDLLELLYRFAPDPAVRKRILVDGPQMLFGRRPIKKFREGDNAASGCNQPGDKRARCLRHHQPD